MLMTRMCRCLLVVAILSQFHLSTSLFAEGTDWLYFRGPQFNGNSTEKNLPDTWEQEGDESNQLWKREDLGGRSTPVVMDGRLYTIVRDKPETNEEREKIVCADAATGITLWEEAWNLYLSDVPDTRVGWSSVVADPESFSIPATDKRPAINVPKRVYALGVQGLFSCFDAETGEELWSHSMHEEYGLLSTYGGRTNFPIIHEGNVIISAVFIGWGEFAKPEHRYIAFDKVTGQPVWFEGTKPLPEDTTYSAPVLTVADGQALLIFGGGDGIVYAKHPRTGKTVWSYELSGRGINTSPVVFGDKVYIGHSEENPGITAMGALVCLNIKDGKEVWKNTEQFVGKSPVIVADKYIIAFEDKGQMLVVDPATGKVLNRSKRSRPIVFSELEEGITAEKLIEETETGHKVDSVMRASPLYADGKLYVLTGNGRWYIYKLVEQKLGEETFVECQELQSLRLSGESGDGSPIAAQGRIYITTSNAMYCIGKAGVEPTADPIPPLAQEAPVAASATPAVVQVDPCESLYFPGQKQRFDVRLYNEKGQWIPNTTPDATYSLTENSAGTISELGGFTTPADMRENGMALVSAKVGELEGKARARIVPNIPWTFDFDNGDIPETWVGMRYRHVPIDFDLLTKLRDETPQAANLYIFLHSEFTNFGPTRKIDDSIPSRQNWTNLLRFMRMLKDRPKTVADAQAKLDEHLTKLKEIGVLESFEWTTWDRTNSAGETVKEPTLTVKSANRIPDGNGVMCKITTIPKGARSQGWIGHPSFHDYTVQPDVYAFKRDNKLPDIGLVAQRYTLDMQGSNQTLQLRFWTPQLERFSVIVPFEWKEDTWYTMKFRAESNEDGKAVLKGKVWPKDADEPEDWTITGEDIIGNTQGSPGFFGNAKDSEIFYDNVTVTPNSAPESKTEGAEATAAEAPEKEKPADGEKPADTAKPDDAAKPADTPKPEDAAKPADTAEPAEAAKPEAEAKPE